MKIVLILPCYNESNNLWKIKKSFLNNKTKLKNAYLDLIIVNNGSTDNSHEILSSKKFMHSNIKTINITKNIGYGHGIKEGIKNINSDIYCWAHGDLQTPMRDIISTLIFALQTEKKIVAGQRYTQGFQKIQSRLFDFIISMILRIKAYDINAQPKIFPVKYKKYFLANKCPDDFALDMYFFKVFYDLKTNVERNYVTFENRTADEAKGGQASILNRALLLIKMSCSALKIRK